MKIMLKNSSKSKIGGLGVNFFSMFYNIKLLFKVFNVFYLLVNIYCMKHETDRN